MNKSTFWKLGFTSALVFSLGACSDTISSDEINGDGELLTEESSSSSAGKDKKSSSSSATLDSAACARISKVSLAAPTDLNVVKSSDNKWVLFWNYTNNEERPDDGFLIEMLDMSDSVPSWAPFDSTSIEVTMYNLVGESKSGKYYRVSAKDECGVSKPTSMVQVSTAGSGSTTASAELAVPTNLKLDTLDNNKWQLSWSYTNNANRPENGFKLQSLDLSAESPTWKDDGKTNKGVHVTIIDGAKKGGLLFHVAAVDTNGTSEYSEQITIPKMPDSASIAGNADMALAVPTDLKLDSMGDNKWKLSWSFTDNSARPANGFILEKLNLSDKTPAWTRSDSTNKGVRFILLDASKLGGQYIRVASKDKNGLSKYSDEIMIPKVGAASTGATAEVKMAVPTDLKVDSLGDNKWIVSWKYSDNAARPEKKGFVVEMIFPESSTLKWATYKTFATGVHSFVLTNTKADSTIRLIRVAAKDANDSLSAFSTEIQLPSYKAFETGKNDAGQVLAKPASLKLDSIGENKWRLSWSYTNNSERPANGFVLQKLDLNGTRVWKDTLSTQKDVKSIIIDNTSKKFSEQYLRVAAKDAKDTSEYSDEIYVPAWVDYSAPATKPALNAPTNLKLESLGENKYNLTWSYTNNKNRAENGFQIQVLDISEASPSWTNYKKTAKGVHVYTIDATTDHEKFFRVAALDGTDTSEYTSEVQVPKVIDNSAKDNTPLAVPTNLKMDSIGENQYRLSWSYTRATNRAEQLFYLEVLDLKADAKKWTKLGTSNAGVHFYILSATEVQKYSEQFIRIAAIDEPDTSDFSTEIQIPKYINYAAIPQPELPIPYNLKLDTLGNGMYQLSWSYDDIAARPENGFVLQTLDPLATSPVWKNDATVINKGVHLAIIDGHESKLGGMLVRVVAVDEKGEQSKFSSAISIPSVADDGTVNDGSVKTALNVPTDLSIEDLGQNKYKLSWKYTNAAGRSENGFVIEELDEGATTIEWTRKNALTTKKGVQFIVVAASENAVSYRVAAQDDKGESEFSTSVQVPKAMENPPKNGCVGEFAAPTALAAERVAPSAWRLKWNYSENSKCVTEGFIVEIRDAKGTNTWTPLDTLLSNVHSFNLKGLNYLDKYYRVVALRGDVLSDVSSEVQVTRSTKYSEDIPFTAPEAKARIYALGDFTDPDNPIFTGFEFQLVVTENYPTHSIINSEFTDTKSLQYQFRWNNEKGGTTGNQWTTVDITEANAYLTTATKNPNIGTIDELCKSYASVRILWQDDETIDSTEWSNPTGPLYNKNVEYINSDRLCDPN